MMMHAHRRLAAASLLVMATTLGACGSGGTPAATATPAATEPAAAAFLIRTPAVEPQACMEALATGKLARHALSGLGLTTADGEQMPVEWPFRYRAFEENRRVSLVDETGKVVAREGDEITVGGGFGNQLWHACGPVTITKPAT